MGSVLEKITLYDLFGYMIPGSLVTGAAGYVILASGNDTIGNWYKDYTGLILYFFIILSFICGILLSELGDALFTIVDSGKKTYQYPISYNIVQEAMEKAGLKVSSFDEQQTGKYLRAMFGDIQSDTNYSRIHNYASAKHMYKNLMVAAIIIMLLSGYLTQKQNCCYTMWVVLTGCIIIFFFWRRYRRFEEKTREYTVYWYVEKYLGNKESKCP